MNGCGIWGRSVEFELPELLHWRRTGVDPFWIMSDSLASKEKLHPTMEMDEMKNGFFVGVVVRQSTAILELLASQEDLGIGFGISHGKQCRDECTYQLKGYDQSREEEVLLVRMKLQ